jgi:hypothetical protein
VGPGDAFVFLPCIQCLFLLWAVRGLPCGLPVASLVAFRAARTDYKDSVSSEPGFLVTRTLLIPLCIADSLQHLPPLPPLPPLTNLDVTAMCALVSEVSYAFHGPDVAQSTHRNSSQDSKHQDSIAASDDHRNSEAMSVAQAKVQTTVGAGVRPDDIAVSSPLENGVGSAACGGTSEANMRETVASGCAAKACTSMVATTLGAAVDLRSTSSVSFDRQRLQGVLRAWSQRTVHWRVSTQWAGDHD